MIYTKYNPNIVAPDLIILLVNLDGKYKDNCLSMIFRMGLENEISQAL